MTEPEAEKLWSFEQGIDLRAVEDRLSSASLSYSRHSTTVSYFLRLGEAPRLDSYELHAVYTGRYLANGDAEVDKSYLRNSYSILQGTQGSHWIAEGPGEDISQEDFYSMVLYERPDRMLSLQEVSFDTVTGSYLVELNLESGLLVLVAIEGTDHIPALIADMVMPEEISRSSYLFELFEHNGGPLSP